jgi:hypothetical protein
VARVLAFAIQRQGLNHEEHEAKAIDLPSSCSSWFNLRRDPSKSESLKHEAHEESKRERAI